MSNSFYAVIDKEALKNNIEYLKNFKNKDILPVIKANAYGHDIFLIAKLLYDLNVKTWAVARLSEALGLIEYFKTLSIDDFRVLVFESIDNYKVLNENKNIYPSINNLEEFKNALANNIETERMSLKIDLGFARNGISENEIESLKKLAKFNDWKFFGIFSHLFSVEYENGFNVIKKFTNIVNSLGKNKFSIIHLQNAAGIYNYDIEIVTHLRTGMLVYGLQEPGYYDTNLKPVLFELTGKVDTVKYANEIDYVAYETLESVDASTTKIAKIKIGYGDGFPKCNKNTYCLINKKEYKISQVTMDNTFIEVDDKVKVGDRVQLYHRPNELKAKTGCGALELYIALSPLRIKRVLKGELNTDD
ncbi:MAG: alanine racemase [Fusobacterium sp.]|uniref:alanine racemase n=1 Tax=Fusobacterium sp. TaxID=68766 RepID=UPI0026DDBC35|nr:alanine racemase [Fusobacterium sp.]MDO4690139.1 alanine racemase [Fusobacterium sp.]